MGGKKPVETQRKNKPWFLRRWH